MSKNFKAMLILGCLALAWSPMALADIYLDEPEGWEVYVSGETMHISWMTVPGDDPDGDWLNVYYIWAGTSTEHLIATVGDSTQIHQGSHDWTVPEVTEISYLSIRISWDRDAGPTMSSDQSLNVIILPSADTPSVYLSDPQPSEEDVLIIPGGSTYTVRWDVTGCKASTEDVPMTIRFSPTGSPLDYTDVDTVLPCQVSNFAWEVPDLETENAHIRLVWSDLSQSVCNHPFTITADPDPNYPPVADAGANQTVPERALVSLDGSASSDPNGDFLTYHWERVDGGASFDFTITGEHSREASFTAPDLDFAEFTFVFRLTVEDPEGLRSFDTVDVTVTGTGPGIESVSPLTGWFKTPITVTGNDLRGCGVYIGPDRVTTIPDHPDYDGGATFYLDDLPPGLASITVDCPTVGAISYWQNFLVLRVPYQWDWGYRFHNQSGYLMSWQDVVNTFGFDASHMWLCCDFDGLFCERRCHDPLMQLVYDYYIRELGMGGSCWGMCAASSRYAMGSLSMNPGNELRDYGWQLEPTESTMAPIVKSHHISQVSAEVIGYLLDHVGDDPLDIAQQVDTDTQEGHHGVVSINQMTAGVSPLSLSGHALSVDRVVQISAEEYWIYVYDPNVEEFSVARDETDIDDYERLTTQEEYPFIRVFERESGTRAWEFEMVDGTMWSGDDRYNISTSFGDIPYYGLTYYPPGLVDGPYTAPLSLEGIIMILGADADAAIEDEEGRRLGVDDAGDLVMEIPDAVPVLSVADSDARPGEMFVLPEDAYTTTVHGREAGAYTYAALHQGRMFAVREVGMDTDTRDTVAVDPDAGSLALGTADVDKAFEAVLVERVEGADDTYQRTFELTDGRLMAGELVRFATVDGHDALTIENTSDRDMRFTARLSQASLGPQPEPPDVQDHTLVIADIEVPAGTLLKVTPSDWTQLGQATAKLEVDGDPDTDPDGDPAAGGCGCTTPETRGGPGWLLLLFLMGLALRRPSG